MLIKKSGIFKTIDSKDFGIFQLKGWEKVVIETLPKLEELEELEEKIIIDEPAPVVEAGKGIAEEPIREVAQEEPIEEVVEEMPKSKKNRRK